MNDKTQMRQEEIAWREIQRRAKACAATFLRTDPVDGPRRYLCSWNDQLVFHTFWSLAEVQAHLMEIEAENAAMVERQRNASPLSEDDMRIHRMWAHLGALSSKIAVLDKQLSGERPVARVRLVMAEAEGRNLLAELEDRRAAAIRERLELADELTQASRRPPRYAEYVAAVHALTGK